MMKVLVRNHFLNYLQIKKSKIYNKNNIYLKKIIKKFKNKLVKEVENLIKLLINKLILKLKNIN